MIYEGMKLVFKAHRLVYHSTLGLRVIKKKKKKSVTDLARSEVMKSGSDMPSGRSSMFTVISTQGQIDGFFSQLPYNCHQNRVASVGD